MPTSQDLLVKDLSDLHSAELQILDAALIGAAQRVEHYEMAGYGCARTYARMLGLDAGVPLLQQTLDEEGQADDLLTRLAESKINPQTPHDPPEPGLPDGPQRPYPRTAQAANGSERPGPPAGRPRVPDAAPSGLCAHAGEARRGAAVGQPPTRRQPIPTDRGAAGR